MLTALKVILNCSKIFKNLKKDKKTEEGQN